MRKAKKEKLTLIIALLDIIQAYDKVGHEHLIKILHSHPIPTHLRNLIISLIIDNKNQIMTADGKTKIINFLFALLQGSPLSPFLFNIAIDPVLDALTEKEVSNEFGFSLDPSLEKLTNQCFADDDCIFSNSLFGATELIKMAKYWFDSLGLKISYEKSVAISIVNGKLQPNSNIEIDEHNFITGVFV